MSYFSKFLLKLVTQGQETCTSFQASFYDYVLASHCSDIAYQLINVEICSKTSASFLPVCHQL